MNIGLVSTINNYRNELLAWVRKFGKLFSIKGILNLAKIVNLIVDLITKELLGLNENIRFKVIDPRIMDERYLPNYISLIFPFSHRGASPTVGEIIISRIRTSRIVLFQLLNLSIHEMNTFWHTKKESFEGLDLNIVIRFNEFKFTILQLDYILLATFISLLIVNEVCETLLELSSTNKILCLNNFTFSWKFLYLIFIALLDLCLKEFDNCLLHLIPILKVRNCLAGNAQSIKLFSPANSGFDGTLNQSLEINSI